MRPAGRGAILVSGRRKVKFTTKSTKTTKKTEKLCDFLVRFWHPAEAARRTGLRPARHGAGTCSRNTLNQQQTGGGHD